MSEWASAKGELRHLFNLESNKKRSFVFLSRSSLQIRTVDVDFTTDDFEVG
jgi:hypothetical protein